MFVTYLLQARKILHSLTEPHRGSAKRPQNSPKVCGGRRRARKSGTKDRYKVPKGMVQRGAAVALFRIRFFSCEGFFVFR